MNCSRKRGAGRSVRPWWIYRLTITLVGFVFCASAMAQSQKPNIVFVFLDDATYDEIGDAAVDQYFPNIRVHLQEAGTRYTNFHVVAPLCAPSRGSLFRSQYPHNTDVKVTASGFTIFHDKGYTDSEIGMWMKEAGYRTALVGKYCHEQYPVASRDLRYQPPGWDEFHASLGGKYFNLPVNSNGNRSTTPEYPDGYRTDIERDTAVSIIDEHDFSQPLFLYVPVFAPHFQSGNSDDPMFAPRHADLFPEAIVPRVPSFNEADVSDKTPQYASLPLFSDSQVSILDGQYRDRLRAVKAVDDLVGRVVDSLESRGVLENTYIFMTSDNGFQQGHHRDFAKKDPFDRTTRVQMLVRGPNVPADFTTNHLLAHIDLPATFLSLAGAQPPAFIDGRSFQELMVNPAAVPEEEWRSDLLIENTEPKTRGPVVLDENYVALRMYDSIYVEWNNGDREYYDLALDPFQLDNIWAQLDPTRAAEVAQRLDTLRNCRAGECNDLGPAPTFDTTLSFDNDALFDDTPVLFGGTASASDGVGTVELVIRRVSDRNYWNGSTFGPDYVALSVATSSPGSASSDWSYQLDAPAVGEQYWASARAVDQDGNEAPDAATAFFSLDLPSDTQPPSAQLLEPATDQTVASPVAFSGEALDDVGLLRVELVIRNRQTGLYWTEEGYRNQFTRLPTTLVDSTPTRSLWEAGPFPLDDGPHYVGIRSTDRALNRNLQREDVQVGEPQVVDALGE